MSETTRCWQCGGRLGEHPKTGKLIYRLVSGLRVHKICETDAKRVWKGMQEPLDGEQGRTEPAATDQ